MKNERTSDEQIFFHIDVNSAFLSWTALRLLREGSSVDLRTIPSVIGGDQETRHGIVVAKSIPAKAYGIETAEPVASALKKCPNLTVVRSDHGYYSKCSHALMEYLSSICDQIEQVSIDECYMSYEPIRGVYGTPEETAAFIKDSVYEKFGFTVNVGISDRKVLAKMASDFKKPNLVHTLYVREIKEKLWPLPIGTMHMCGKSSAAFLRKMGIMTIGDLATTDPALVDSWLKSHGRLLWRYANGIDNHVVETEPYQVKGVGNSTTLAKDAVTAEEAYTVIGELSESVSGRLKKKHFLAGQVCVEIKYATFRSVSHQASLQVQTSSAERIAREACRLFDELWNGEPIRLLGVRTTKVIDEEEPVQMDLFSYQKDLKKEKEKEQAQAREKKREQLEQALLGIRKKYGEDSVVRAGEDSVIRAGKDGGITSGKAGAFESGGPEDPYS